MARGAASDISLNILGQTLPVEIPLDWGSGALGAKMAAEGGVVSFAKDLWMEQSGDAELAGCALADEPIFKCILLGSPRMLLPAHFAVLRVPRGSL